MKNKMSKKQKGEEKEKEKKREKTNKKIPFIETYFGTGLIKGT